jgi:hypothetical protein
MESNQLRIAELEGLLQQEKQNRHDERLGRINAEKKIAEVLCFCHMLKLLPIHDHCLFIQAQLLQERHPAGVGTLFPIGTIRSVFKDRRGAPRQGCLVPGALARLELSHGVQRDSLQGLGSFSHLWLIFVFHQNTNTATLLVCFGSHLLAALPIFLLSLQCHSDVRSCVRRRPRKHLPAAWMKVFQRGVLPLPPNTFPG